MRRPGRQFDRDAFKLLRRLGDQFRQADGGQQACGNPAANVSPICVSTGKPTHNASLAVVCAL